MMDGKATRRRGEIGMQCWPFVKYCMLDRCSVTIMHVMMIDLLKSQELRPPRLTSKVSEGKVVRPECRDLSRPPRLVVL